jgi:hypothetical protein
MMCEQTVLIVNQNCAKIQNRSFNNHFLFLQELFEFWLSFDQQLAQFVRTS